MNDNLIKCPVCGELVKRGNGHHMRACRIKYLSSLSETEIQNWKDLYLKQGKSLVQISEETGLPYQWCSKILEELGVQLRNIKQASIMPDKKTKYEKTMLERWGTKHNFDKDNPSRKKWEKRLLEEEGITNVFQRESVKVKIKNTLNERYTKDEIYNNYAKGSTLQYWIGKLGEEEGIKRFNQICHDKGKSMRKSYYIEKYGTKKGLKLYNEKLKNICKGFAHNNGLNEQFEKMLLKYNVQYEKEYYLPSSKYGYHYDFKINNLIIELNGIYWHCSPKKYKPNDKVKFPNNKYIIAKDKWKYDEEKYNFAIDSGYQCEVLWEDELSEPRLLNILDKHHIKYGSCKN